MQNAHHNKLFGLSGFGPAKKKSVLKNSLAEAFRKKISMKMRQESELRVNSIQTKETSVNSRDKKFESNNKIIVDMAKQSDFIIDMVDQDFFDRKKAKTPL